MAEKEKPTIITAQQRRMAELLLQGEKTITDCYIEAYRCDGIYAFT